MVDIAKLRAALKWSQLQMGECLGCHQSSVHRMETGQPPSPGDARVLARLSELVEAGHVVPDMPVTAVLDLVFGRSLAVSSYSHQSLQKQSA